MYTNNPPAGAFRGFGVTQSAFAVESMMDMLAEELKMDPIELRRKNALHVGSMTNTGQILRESVGLSECLEKVEAEIHKDGPDALQPKSDPQNPHLVTAWGLPQLIRTLVWGAVRRIFPMQRSNCLKTGNFEIRCSSAEMGQGLVTVMRSIVAEEMNRSTFAGARFSDGYRPNPEWRPHNSLPADICDRKCIPVRRQGIERCDHSLSWRKSMIFTPGKDRFSKRVGLWWRPAYPLEKLPDRNDWMDGNTEGNL